MRVRERVRRERGGRERKRERDKEHCLITLEKQVDKRTAYGLGFIFIILVRRMKC